MQGWTWAHSSLMAVSVPSLNVTKLCLIMFHTSMHSSPAHNARPCHSTLSAATTDRLCAAQCNEVLGGGYVQKVENLVRRKFGTNSETQLKHLVPNTEIVDQQAQTLSSGCYVLWALSGCWYFMVAPAGPISLPKGPCRANRAGTRGLCRPVPCYSPTCALLVVSVQAVQGQGVP